MPRFALRVELSDGRSFTHELAPGRTTLGRSSAAGLTLAEDGVSREHAALVLAGGALVVEDLGSTNGTRKNGALVDGSAGLGDGDQLAIGRALVTVLVDARESVDTPGQAATPLVSAIATRAVDEDDALADEQRGLRALYQLSRALDAELSAGELRRRIVEAARAVLEGERASLRWGADAIDEGGAPLVPAELAARVVEERRAVLTAVDARSLLAVPVRRAKSVGVLAVDSATRRFQPRDLDLLTILANQAAALLDNHELVRELRAVNERLVVENVQLRGRFGFAGILGDSGKLQETLRTVERLCETSATVLLTGESGTGKELIARTIHENSPRRGEPFVALNCAAIPEPLIEAELFGIEKGVATGVDRRVGRFEAAGAGTLFLDEVGELPLAAQAKLLRVLEERVVERVGGREPHPVKARIVAATNRNLAAELAGGRFREDLYYRLNVVPLRLPPLRERPGDVGVLAEAFLRRFAAEQKRPVRGISDAARAALEAWHWPGNVRELQNELERAVTVWEPRGEGGERELLLPEHLSEHVREAAARPGRFVDELEPGDIKEVVAGLVERAERQLIRAALARSGDNRARAAALLGLTREGLRKKMIRYGMDRE